VIGTVTHESIIQRLVAENEAVEAAPETTEGAPKTPGFSRGS
jgi:hypothetical protein